MQDIQKTKAQEIAIFALQRLANDETLFYRFIDLTGITPQDIKSLAHESEFLAAVLDFFLAHEPDLLAWTEDDGINPETIAQARLALMPHDLTGFE